MGRRRCQMGNERCVEGNSFCDPVFSQPSIPGVMAAAIVPIDIKPELLSDY
jgi:hypothetical protein